MGSVLVVGASGQLGSEILARLLKEGRACSILLRTSSNFSPPATKGLRVARGDLADLASVEQACASADRVIATANTIVPRPGDRFGVSELLHYRNLLIACRRRRVRHIVYVSAFSTPHDRCVPEFRIKRQIERLIADSGVPFTIFRSAAFMDVYFAVMGSRLASQGVARPTLSRGFWLTKAYGRWTQGLLEDRGLALVPGNGRARHAFICIRDVAAFMIKALDLPEVLDRIIELAGPEALSWREVAGLYAEVLGRKVRPLPIPLLFLNAVRMLLRPVSPAGDNLFSSLALVSKHDVAADMTGASERFGLELTGVRRFLVEKQQVGKLQAEHDGARTTSVAPGLPDARTWPAVSEKEAVRS